MEPIGATQLVRYEPDQVSALVNTSLVYLLKWISQQSQFSQTRRSTIDKSSDWGGSDSEIRPCSRRLHGLHVLCMGDQQGIVIEGAVLKLRNLPHCELCPANEWSWLIQLQPVMYRTECKDNQSSATWFLRKYWKQNPESYSFIQSNPNCLFFRQLAPGADRAHLRSRFESCRRVREAAEIRYLSLSGPFRRAL